MLRSDSVTIGRYDDDRPKTGIVVGANYTSVGFF